MELRADHVVAPDDGGERAAIVGLRHQIAALRRFELEAVHEIGMQPVRPERNVLEQRVGLQHIERVPAHVRNFQRCIVRRDAIDLAGDPAEARRHLIFASALGHQLHADANAEKRLRPAAYALIQCIDHARNSVEPAPAIGKGADAGQHHAVRARDLRRIAGDHDGLIVPALARGAFEGLRRRVQIAGAVVDDGDAHRPLPGSGNRPITSDGDGVPRRTGAA